MRRSVAIFLVLTLTACSDTSPLGPDPVEPDAPASFTVVPTGDSGLPFGPVVVEKEWFWPTYVHADVSSDGFEPPFRLVIENDGTYGPPVRCALVLLDGEVVFPVHAFLGFHPTELLEAEVDLTPNSSLDILVCGRRGPAFRVRIEASGEVLAGPGGGEVELGGGDVQLDLPAGAVTEEVVLTAEPVEEPPSGGAGGLDGTVFNLGPEGQQFEEPIELTFSYDPQVLTTANPNAREEDLRLFTLENGVWRPLEGGSVDPVTKEVSGLTTHFSQFGILTLTEVCPGEFGTVQEAYDATIPGGLISICDHQTHAVEGVVLDAPVSILAAPGASPVLHTATELSALNVDGFSQGVVLIDGMTFDFDTPDGGEGMRSHAIRAEGTFDQLVVTGSTFDIDPGARGAVAVGASTVPTSKASIDDVIITGGAVGVAVVDNLADVTNSDISGMSLIGVSHSAEGGTGGGGLVQGNSFEDCGSRCVRPRTGAIVDVVGNIFGQCGSLRCISIGSAAQVQVLSNTFAAPVLTGDSGPDQNNIILFTGASTGLVDGNVFNGCGFFHCMQSINGSAVTVSNNQFDHVSGQAEDAGSHTMVVWGGATITAENNVINACAVFCYRAADDATLIVRNETISVPAGHGTLDVVHGEHFDPALANNTIVFENNVVTGAGAGHAAFLMNTDATLTGNTFTGLAGGIELHAAATITGRDNSIEMVPGLAAVEIFEDGFADLRFNDFTGQAVGIGSAGDGTSVLTCNWWGDAAGPQNVDPGVPSTVYIPWATAPIANGAGGACDGGP